MDPDSLIKKLKSSTKSHHHHEGMEVDAEEEELEEEEEEAMTVADCIKMAKEAFVDNIPFEALKADDIPKKYQYGLGFIAYVTLGVLFLYSLVTGYIDALEEKFMSLDSESGNCTTVPIALTDSFVMDKNGNWEGKYLLLSVHAIIHLLDRSLHYYIYAYISVITYIHIILSYTLL